MRKLFTLLLMMAFIGLNAQNWQQVGAGIVGQNSDRIGERVAISASGDLIAVGAFYFDVEAVINSGLARGYYFEDGAWQVGGQVAGAEQEKVGSVAYNEDGSIVAVGSASSGGVRVYNTTGETLVQIGSDITGPADSYWGYQLSLNDDGTILAIGAYDYDEGEDLDFGMVEVYKFADGSWSLMGARLKRHDGDKFGIDVELNGDGDKVVIGAYEADDLHVNLGMVAVYAYDETNGWELQGEEIWGDAVSDRFGNAVDINKAGDIIIAGGSNIGTASGVARVYQWSGTAWAQVGADLTLPVANDNDHFGSQVGINGVGDKVIVSATGYDVGTDTDEGIVKVFRLVDSAWESYGEFTGEAGDQLGTSCGIDDSGMKIIFSSAPISTAGYVKVYCDNPSNEVSLDNGVLTASAIGTFISYQWVDCGNSNMPIDGEVSQSFTPTTSGSYACEISNGSCEVMSTCINVVVTGIDDTFKDKVKLYPNPTSGEVNIVIDDLMGDVVVKVRSLTGAVVHQQVFGASDNLNFNINSAQGIYLVEVQSEDNTAIFRVVKR